MGFVIKTCYYFFFVRFVFAASSKVVPLDKPVNVSISSPRVFTITGDASFADIFVDLPAMRQYISLISTYLESMNRHEQDQLYTIKQIFSVMNISAYDYNKQMNDVRRLYTQFDKSFMDFSKSINGISNNFLLAYNETNFDYNKRMFDLFRKFDTLSAFLDQLVLSQSTGNDLMSDMNVILYKQLSQIANNTNYSRANSENWDYIHKFIYGDGAKFGGLFDGLLGDVGALFSSIFSGVIKEIGSLAEDILKFVIKLAVAIIEPVIKEILRVLSDLLPVFEDLLKKILDILIEIFHRLNNKYFALEFLFLISIIFFYFKDIFVTAGFALIVLLLFDISR